MPITILLRKSLKNAKTGSAKEGTLVKVFIERVEESARWIEQKRKSVQFAPGKIKAVQDWERDLKAKLGESPLGKYVKVQRKTREKRRKLVEKVCFLFESVRRLIFIANRLGKAKTRFWRRIEYEFCLLVLFILRRSKRHRFGSCQLPYFYAMRKVPKCEILKWKTREIYTSTSTLPLRART